MAELTNTRSGTSGEVIVAAALMRAGLRVLRPFWDDDEKDLLILDDWSRLAVPLPVQVKSFQDRAASAAVEVRKAYVENNPGL